MHLLSVRTIYGKLNIFNALLVIWWIGLCVFYLNASSENISRSRTIETYTDAEKILLKQQSCVRDARPCPRLDLNRTDDYLVDLPRFKYLLNAAACNSKESVVVLIHSACKHFNERESIRTSWGNGSPRLKRFTIKLVFLLAVTNDNEIQERIVQEHRRHNDIVQGNFVDAYRNLTYKHVMGLKWVWEHCSQAPRVLKMDDDVFVHIFNFHKLIRNTTDNVNSLICYVQRQMPVTRDEGSKWMVRTPEYPLFYYEDYCSGWAYLMTPDIARRLYLEARYRPFFWVDDVHVTGTLAKMAGISRLRINEKFTTEAESTTTWSNSETQKDWRFVFGPTWGDPQLVYKAHRKAVECEKKKCSCCFDLMTVQIEETKETLNTPRKGKAMVISLQ